MARFTRALLALALLSPLASAQNVDVEELILDNGMKFLLLPRYEEPNTISAGWVAKVGSVNERPGITGISHFFEHMMFKGTTTVGTRNAAQDQRFMDEQKDIKTKINQIVWTEQYDRFLAGEIDDPWNPENDTEALRTLRAELKEAMDTHKEAIVKNEFDSLYSAEGARGMNAFTSHDMTFYFIDVPSNKLELWAWMESDRLKDSVFREFYSERDVVHEERRMRLESSPTGRLDEQFDAMFWQSSPYSWSVIGWPTDLNSYTRQDFDSYFNVYYRPNNLVGIIVGDFDPANAEELISQYFGPIPRGEVEPPPVVTLEMPQIAEKRMIGECECQDQIEVRYHTAPFMHRDSYPLDVLAEILNGRTGRLYKDLVEGQEIAQSARVSQDSRKYAGAFSFSAQTKGDATPDDLEQAWYAQVEMLKTEPVNEYELQKVKNQIAADSYRQLQSNDFLRLQLGFFEATRSWRYINEGSKLLQEVTAEDIQRVANTYFEETNRSVAVYTRIEGSEPENPLFAALSPEMQGQAKMMLDQIKAQFAGNEEQLPGMAEMMRGQLTSAPEEYRPMIEYVLGEIETMIAEAGGAKSTDESESESESEG
ncbi:MAG: pitrilysin family protein [Planctomycetota bacterium]|nr:pitrilysin family protein [Planctomycetota bacterium]